MPKSAYALFLAECKKAMKEKDVKEVRVLAKQKWADMDAEKRKPYEEQSNKMKADAIEAGLIKPKVKKVQMVIDPNTGELVPKKTKKQIAAEKRIAREAEQKAKKQARAEKAAAERKKKEAEKKRQQLAKAESLRKAQVSKLDAKIAYLEQKLADVRPPVDDVDLPPMRCPP